MGEENLAGGTSWAGNMQTRQGKEIGIKCQEEPRATRLVQSLLWEELFHLTGHSPGWGHRVGHEMWCEWGQGEGPALFGALTPCSLGLALGQETQLSHLLNCLSRACLKGVVVIEGEGKWKFLVNYDGLSRHEGGTWEQVRRWGWKRGEGKVIR